MVPNSSFLICICLIMSCFHVPLGEMSIQVFCPFFHWVVFMLLSCISCLYILEIRPLTVASFESIFSHSIGCIFFFVVSFAVQNLVSLIRSFISVALGG